MSLTTMFLGTSTVLITDGSSSILVDGFFSRPMILKDGALDLDLEIRPDETKIRAALDRAGIDRLDMVVVSHSHIDHAMDSPVVAELTGARLAGSRSTAMIARGYGFPDAQFVHLESEQPITVGSFVLTPITALHSNGDAIPGEITEPITLPARALDYKTGGCFDFHLAHDEGSVLIHATANFIPHALADYPADVLYLGVGAAGVQDAAWRAQYWRETVETTGARVVRAVHWERFWEPIDEPFVPLPPPLDDFEVTQADFADRAAAAGIRYELPELWKAEPVEATSNG